MIPILLLLQAGFVAGLSLFGRILVTGNGTAPELRFYAVFMVIFTVVSVATQGLQHGIVKAGTGRRLALSEPRKALILKASLAGLTLLALASLGLFVAAGSGSLISTSILITFPTLVLLSIYSVGLGNLLVKQQMKLFIALPALIVLFQVSGAVAILKWANLALNSYLAFFTAIPALVMGSYLMFQRKRSSDVRLPRFCGLLARSSLVSLLTWLYVQADQIVLPQIFSEEETIAYVRYSTVARLPLLVASSLAPILLTKVTRDPSGLRRGMGFSTAAIISTGACVYATSGFWSDIIYGAETLRPWTISSLLASLLQISSGLLALISFVWMDKMTTLFILLAAVGTSSIGYSLLIVPRGIQMQISQALAAVNAGQLLTLLILCIALMRSKNIGQRFLKDT